MQSRTRNPMAAPAPQKWPPERDAVLRALYPDLHNDEVAQRMQSTPASVAARASKLHLYKSAAYKRHIYRTTTRQRSPWNAQMEELMVLLYPHALPGQLEALMGMPSSTLTSKAQDMGIKKAPEVLSLLARRRDAALRKKDPEAYLKNRLQPGNIPWNKGAKGLKKGGGATRFAAGNTPPTLLPVGTLRMHTVSGTPNVLRKKVAHPDVWRRVDHLVWEQANGRPMPAKHILRHADGNRQNHAPENLYVVSTSDFARHASPLCNHSLPPELSYVLRLRGALTRTINHSHKRMAKAAATPTQQPSPP